MHKTVTIECLTCGQIISTLNTLHAFTVATRPEVHSTRTGVHRPTTFLHECRVTTNVMSYQPITSFLQNNQLDMSLISVLASQAHSSLHHFNHWFFPSHDLGLLSRLTINIHAPKTTSRLYHIHIISYHKKSRLGRRKCPKGTTRAPNTVNDKNSAKMLKNGSWII